MRGRRGLRRALRGPRSCRIGRRPIHASRDRPFVEHRGFPDAYDALRLEDRGELVVYEPEVKALTWAPIDRSLAKELNETDDRSGSLWRQGAPDGDVIRFPFLQGPKQISYFHHATSLRGLPGPGIPFKPAFQRDTREALSMNCHSLVAAVQKSRHLSGLLRGRALSGIALPLSPSAIAVAPSRRGRSGRRVLRFRSQGAG